MLSSVGMQFRVLRTEWVVGFEQSRTSRCELVILVMKVSKPAWGAWPIKPIVLEPWGNVTRVWFVVNVQK